MNRLKEFMSKHAYKVFISFFLILSIAPIIFVKIKTNAIASIYTDLTSELDVIFIITAVFSSLTFILALGFMTFVRNEVVGFSNKMCKVIDDVITKRNNIVFDMNEETLMSKMESKLKHLIEVMRNEREKSMSEKDNIKTLISDISHQIKTPIANISMYNETLIERDLPRDKEKMFLNNMMVQVNKLQWLVEALIKMSRLENGVIALNKTEANISETIANALSGIYIKAENKDIKVSVDCDSSLTLNHDTKWTSEAIFNVLENAVKYTNKGGRIHISAEKWDIFTKIDVEDNGIGIAGNEINNIFKRFYRSSEVCAIDGIGIGLYLTREIITNHGGYIKVKSKKEVGSTFSLFLPN